MSIRNNVARLPLYSHRLRAALTYWVLIPGLLLAGGQLSDRLLGLNRFSLAPAGATLAMALLLTGLAWIAWSTRDLRHLGGGTPSPAQPPRRLVTTGSYGLCRHPMFMGYNLASLGVLLFWGSPGALLAGWPLMLLWELKLLHREEHLLALRFSHEFASYRARVPMLLPSFPLRCSSHD